MVVHGVVVAKLKFLNIFFEKENHNQPLSHPLNKLGRCSVGGKAIAIKIKTIVMKILRNYFKSFNP